MWPLILVARWRVLLLLRRVWLLVVLLGLLVGHSLGVRLVPMRRVQMRLLSPVLHLGVHLSNATRCAA